MADVRVRKRVTRPDRTVGRTKIARVRLRVGLTQMQVAIRAGIAPVTYQRLERGEIANPQIRMLTNVALVLGVDLLEILEEEWTRWTMFDPDAPEPKDRLRREDTGVELD